MLFFGGLLNVADAALKAVGENLLPTTRDFLYSAVHSSGASGLATPDETEQIDFLQSHQLVEPILQVAPVFVRQPGYPVHNSKTESPKKDPPCRPSR